MDRTISWECFPAPPQRGDGAAKYRRRHRGGHVGTAPDAMGNDIQGVDSMPNQKELLRPLLAKNLKGWASTVYKH